MRIVGRIGLAFSILALGVGLVLPGAVYAQASANLITMTVVVLEADTGKPINQCHVTITFQSVRNTGNALSRSKPLTYSSKTDPQGRCRFLYVPEGSVRVMVTEEHHQTFGQAFQVTKDKSTVEVKLKPPQPLV